MSVMWEYSGFSGGDGYKQKVLPNACYYRKTAGGQALISTEKFILGAYFSLWKHKAQVNTNYVLFVYNPEQHFLCTAPGFFRNK